LSSPDKLLLFDIDGTLILSGGAGETALKHAMRDRFGVEEDMVDIVLAGATDALIARELLQKHGIDCTPENLTALMDSYLEHLEIHLPRHDGALLPGILKLLEALRDRSDCIIGLLTGNLERGAQLKLTHYGVWDFFEFGAYADDSHDRNQLGHFAKSRALEKHGIAFEPESIFILGDTPRDIECAKAIGAHAVAIATGNYTVEELEKHGPEFLFTDLGDTDEIIRRLLGELNVVS